MTTTDSYFRNVVEYWNVTLKGWRVYRANIVDPDEALEVFEGAVSKADETYWRLRDLNDATTIVREHVPKHVEDEAKERAVGRYKVIVESTARVSVAVVVEAENRDDAWAKAERQFCQDENDFAHDLGKFVRFHTDAKKFAKDAGYPVSDIRVELNEGGLEVMGAGDQALPPRLGSCDEFPEIVDGDTGDEEDEHDRFENEYRCERCGNEWTDRWSAMCDDRCPKCDTSMQPLRSFEIDPVTGDRGEMIDHTKPESQDSGDGRGMTPNDVVRASQLLKELEHFNRHYDAFYNQGGHESLDVTVETRCGTPIGKRVITLSARRILEDLDSRRHVIVNELHEMGVDTKGLFECKSQEDL